jgi:PmbA protein
VTHPSHPPTSAMTSDNPTSNATSNATHNPTSQDPTTQDAASAQGLLDLAARASDYAQRHGAQQVSVSAARSRAVELERRDGQLERLQESASAGLTLALYVDGRFSTHSTSDLRWDALRAFIDRAIPMTRLLSPDPYRGLTDPALYQGRSTTDLDLADPAYEAVTPEQRLAAALQAEEGARAAASGATVNSISASYSDSWSRSVLLHSNGFQGEREGTFFSVSASASIQDPSGKKPSESHWVGARHLADLPHDLHDVGAEATQKALRRIGQTRLSSGPMTLVFDNRASRSLIIHWMRGLSGPALQQRRSFLLDKRGERVGNHRFTLLDDPFIPRGFGSALYDADGIAAHPRALVQDGILQSYLIDVYYGRKLGVAPTGGSTTNLIFAPGSRSQEAIIADIPRGVFVTGMLGGNSDTTRGDFSHGVIGFAIEDGKLTAPIGEMNITDSHAALWDRLAEVGDDPFLLSALRTPTLAFEGVSVSGA